MDTTTIVDVTERTDITHEHNFACESVTLVFREEGELAVTCRAPALAKLAHVVDAAARDLAARPAEAAP